MTIDEVEAERVRAELAELMAEFFRAVSFRPGTIPPYRRLHELFVVGGKLIRNNGDAPEITSVEEFIAVIPEMVCVFWKPAMFAAVCAFFLLVKNVVSALQYVCRPAMVLE